MRKNIKIAKVVGVVALTVTLLVGCSNTTSNGSTDGQTSTETEEGADAGSEENASIETSTDASDDNEKEETTQVEADTTITLGDTITIDGKGAAQENNIVTISEKGVYSISGTLADGRIVVNTEEEVTLVLNGVDITSSDGPAIEVEEASAINLILADGTENKLADGSQYAADATGKACIYSKAAINVSGSGSLDVQGNYDHGIFSSDVFTIENGTVTIAAIGDGIHAKGDVNLNGGEVTITQADEGIESKTTLTVNDGTYIVKASDDGINSTNEIVINGGNLYVDSEKGDGLDSNGDLTINGGVVIAMGAQMPEGGADCDQNTFTITGGTLIATGGINSTPSEDTTTQCCALLGSAEEDSIVRIEQDGNEVLTFKVSKAYTNLLFSSDKLELGKEYTVYVDGTIEGGTEFYGYYTGATYTKGTESTTFTTESVITNAGGTTQEMGGGMPKGPGPNMENGEKPSGERPEMDGNFQPGTEGNTPQTPDTNADSTNTTDTTKSTNTTDSTL